MTEDFREDSEIESNESIFEFKSYESQFSLCALILARSRQYGEIAGIGGLCMFSTCLR